MVVTSTTQSKSTLSSRLSKTPSSYSVLTPLQLKEEKHSRKSGKLWLTSPELIKKEDIVYPHEEQTISTEPYFRRIWQHYREHTFRLRITQLVEENVVSVEDAEATRRFLSLRTGSPALTTYLYAQLGRLPNIESNPDFHATQRVMEKLGLDNIDVDRKSAQPYEEQFWAQFDILQQLSEQDLK